MKMRNYSKTELFSLAMISSLTIICYGQVYNHQFLYDTVGFVLENTHIREFSISNTAWVFTHAFRENWQPVTWLSHTLDFELFGMNAGGHHLVNVFIHLVNSVLLFYLIRGLFLRSQNQRVQVEIIAGLSALIFAIHPQHVESVAMIAERKDTLYCFFTLLCCFSYLRYFDATPGSQLRRKWYLTTVGLFVINLMSKPMALTLPIVFLAFDMILVGNRNFFKGDFFRYRLSDKLPLLLLSIITTVITLITQQTAMVPWEFLTLTHRISHVIHNIAFYTEKFLIPINLSPYYPFSPLDRMLEPVYWLPGLTFIAITTFVCILLYMKGKAGFLVGWLCFLITLAPVSGFLQVGTAVATDHYVYTATIPFGVFLAWTSVTAAAKWVRVQPAIVAVITIYLSSYVLLTHLQTSFWQSPFHLWTRTVALYPNAVLPRRNLVINYMLIKEYDAALEHLRYLGIEGKDLLEVIQQERATQEQMSD